MLSLPLTSMLLLKASTVHPALFHALVTFEDMNNGLHEAPECDPAFTEFTDERCEIVAKIQETRAKYDTQWVLVVPPSLCRIEWETPAYWEGIPLIQENDWPGSHGVANFWDMNHLSATGSPTYSNRIVSQPPERAPRVE